MGLADVVSEGFYEQLDFSSTATNIITSNNLVRPPPSLSLLPDLSCCANFLLCKSWIAESSRGLVRGVR